MELNQSEFARMCGVSPMAVSLSVKNGKLLKNSRGFIETDIEPNNSYLCRKLTKNHNKQISDSGDFDIFAGLNEQTELGEKVYSTEGKEAVAACKALIRYIEKQEETMALNSKLIRKPIDNATLHLLQKIGETVIKSKEFDNQWTHDALIMAMNQEYRLPYLQALGKSRKQKGLVTI